MAELAVEATGLLKRYGGRAALSGVGIRVERGTTYALAGPAESGKTTALRVFVGLTRATAGEVTVLGRKVPDRRLRSRVGYMPRQIGLYSDMTVRENLELFSEIHGLAATDIEVREAWLIELLDLVEWRSVLVARLPPGVRRRVSLAATLIHQPEMVVLDDPTQGDPELRVSFWALAGRLRANGVTVLMATRDLEEASRCDRVGLLRRGSLLGEGSPDELRRRTTSQTLEDAYLALARKGEAT